MQFLLCLLPDVNYKNIFQQIIQRGERLKEPIPSLKIGMRPRKKRVNPKKSILLVKQRNSTGNRQCRTPTLSGRAHHVLVFTVKRRCVLFSDIIEYKV